MHPWMNAWLGQDSCRANSVEEELIRAKALLEVGKSEEKTHQQMLDGFRIAAEPSKAVETADKQKSPHSKRLQKILDRTLGDISKQFKT